MLVGHDRRTHDLLVRDAPGVGILRPRRPEWTGAVLRPALRLLRALPPRPRELGLHADSLGGLLRLRRGALHDGGHRARPVHTVGGHRRRHARIARRRPVSPTNSGAAPDGRSSIGGASGCCSATKTSIDPRAGSSATDRRRCSSVESFRLCGRSSRCPRASPRWVALDSHPHRDRIGRVGGAARRTRLRRRIELEPRQRGLPRRGVPAIIAVVVLIAFGIWHRWRTVRREALGRQRREDLRRVTVGANAVPGVSRSCRSVR